MRGWRNSHSSSSPSRTHYSSDCGHNFVFIALLWICAAAAPFTSVVNANTDANSFEYKHHGRGRDRDRTDAGAPGLGYVAEWDYVEDPPEANVNVATSRSPADRLDPALWQDNSGAWWLHGGRSQSQRQRDRGRPENLADLWVYKPDLRGNGKYAWYSKLEPRTSSSSSSSSTSASDSSFPEPSINSVLCGTSDGSRIAFFGVGDGSNSLLDDNLVWIYKNPSQSQPTGATTTGDEGIWTSYMCCDVCDPTESSVDSAGSSSNEKSNKTTTNLEFCPHFSQSTTTAPIAIVSKDESKPNSKVEQEQNLESNGDDAEKVNTRKHGHRESGIKVEPILWCGVDDSLMALQLTFSKSQNSVSHEREHEHEGQKAPEPPAHGNTDSANKRAPKVSKELGESYSREEIESATFPSSSSTSTKIHLADYKGQDHEHEHAGALMAMAMAMGMGMARHPHSTNEFPTTSSNSNGPTRPITKSQRGFQQSEIGSAAKISSKDKNKLETHEKYLNWWKFNLGSTEWEKLPQVIMEEAAKEGAGRGRTGIKDSDLIYKLFDPAECRTTSDSIYVYFLCIPGQPGQPPTAATSARDLYLFNPIKSTILRLPTQIQLNVLFADEPSYWTRDYSVLHALRIHERSQTLLMIAYGKLIDFWIHDHETNVVRAAENVWRGSTLDRFQHHEPFYRLKIRVLNGSREYVVFLANPRHMTHTEITETESTNGQRQHQLIFNDISSPSQPSASQTSEHSTSAPNPSSAAATASSSGWFHIKLETDENIFLPSRDASFMINVGDADAGSMDEEPEPEFEPTIEKPITATATASPVNAKTNSTTTATLISPLPRTTFPKVEVEQQFPAADAATGVAVPPEQFPNEKEKIQFNSHSKVDVGPQTQTQLQEEEAEEPRAMPLLLLEHNNGHISSGKSNSNSNNNSISLQNHDDRVIGKFNLNNLSSPASSAPAFSSSSSSSFNLSSVFASGNANTNVNAAANGKPEKLETSSEGTTTFMKFNNVPFSSLSQSQSQSQRQQKRFSLSAFREPLNARKKPATASLIFNGLANDNDARGEMASDAAGSQGIDPNEQKQQPINQKVDGNADVDHTDGQPAATTTNRLIMSPEVDSSQHEPQINNSSTVNITSITANTNPEGQQQDSQSQSQSEQQLEPEIEITLRQSSSSGSDSQSGSPDQDQDPQNDSRDSPSPFSPSEELKLANTGTGSVVELFTESKARESGPGKGEAEVVDIGNIVVDNNYSRSESVVDEDSDSDRDSQNGNANADSRGGPPIAINEDSNSVDVQTRSLWQLAISSSADEDTERSRTASWNYASILFYTLSLAIFATAGVLFFVKRCVSCTTCTTCPRSEKSDEHVLFSESCVRASTSARAGLSHGQLPNATRRLPEEEFYLNTPIV